MSKNVFFNILLILFTIQVSVIKSQEQKRGYLTIEGSIFDENKNLLTDISVTLYENSSKLGTLKTDKTGMFRFDVELNKLYSLEIINEKYYNKKVDINTIVPKAKSRTWFLYSFNIGLLKKVNESSDESIFKKSSTVIKYYEDMGDFNYDEKYKRLMDEEFAKLVAKEKQKWAEQQLYLTENEKKRLKEEVGKLKENDNKQEAVTENIFVNDEKPEMQNSIEENIVNDTVATIKSTQLSPNEKTDTSQMVIIAKKMDEKSYVVNKEKVEEDEVNTIIESKTESKSAMHEFNKSNNIKTAKAAVNSQIKSELMNRIFIHARESEKSYVDNKVKIKTDNIPVRKKTYPIIIEKTKGDYFKTLSKTIIILPEDYIILYKYDYKFGGNYFFRNAQKIEKDDYNYELSKYLTVK